MSQWHSYRKAEPDTLPVTLTEARRHLRVLTNDDDAIVNDALKAACEHVEEVLQRQLIEATWVFQIDDFPSDDGEIVLPRPPCQEIESVTYEDDDGETQTCADYEFRVSNGFGRLIAPDDGWPDAESVTIEYKAGYGDRADVPASIRRAILLALGDYYENTEAQTDRVLSQNPALDRLLAPYWTGDIC